MKKFYSRDDWGTLALICLLAVVAWLALYGAIELVRIWLP